MKIGRNDPCPCGSGKKYKKCCLLKVQSGEYDICIDCGGIMKPLPEITLPTCIKCNRDILPISLDDGSGHMIESNGIRFGNGLWCCMKCFRDMDKKELNEIFSQNEKPVVVTGRIVCLKFPCGLTKEIDQGQLDHSLEWYDIWGDLELCLHECPKNMDVHECDYWNNKMSELKRVSKK